MTKIVEIENLNCKAGQRYLLQNINWQIEQGEHWVVFGMNGCGKTTLLSVIAGMRGFTSGTVKVFGESYTEENVLNLRKQIGFISSSFFDKVLSKESILDIVLGGKSGTVGFNGDIDNHDIIHAKELLKELRLGEKIQRPFDYLSKGERQSVLVARALMAQPKILVLDEPGTGLDVFAREYMLNTVKDLANNSEITIIYVTHYVEEILVDFDNCLLMKNGRIAMSGATEKIFNKENISELLEYPVELKAYGDRKRLEMTVESKLSSII